MRLLNEKELDKLVELGILKRSESNSFSYVNENSINGNHIVNNMFGKNILWILNSPFIILPWMIKKSWYNLGIFEKSIHRLTITHMDKYKNSRILNKKECKKLVKLGLLVETYPKIYDYKYGTYKLSCEMLGRKVKDIYEDYTVHPWMIKKNWKYTELFND